MCIGFSRKLNQISMPSEFGTITTEEFAVACMALLLFSLTTDVIKGRLKLRKSSPRRQVGLLQNSLVYRGS